MAFPLAQAGILVEFPEEVPVFRANVCPGQEIDGSTECIARLRSCLMFLRLRDESCRRKSPKLE